MSNPGWKQKVSGRSGLPDFVSALEKLVGDSNSIKTFLHLLPIFATFDELIHHVLILKNQSNMPKNLAKIEGKPCLTGLFKTQVSYSNFRH